MGSISIPKVRDRFIQHYRLSPPSVRQSGASWYKQARLLVRKMAVEYSCKPSTAAGVIAALSPRAHWKTNVSWACKSLKTKRAVGGLTACVDKAQRILNGERPLRVLQGRKVRAFYRAIMGSDDATVIDVWMIYAAGLRTDRLSQSTYEGMSRALREAAKMCRQTPTVFQAIVWVSVRGRAN